MGLFAVTTLGMLVIDHFGVECLLVSFCQGLLDLDSELLEFLDVVAVVALASFPACFPFSEAVAVEFEALGLFTVAHTFF